MRQVLVIVITIFLIAQHPWVGYAACLPLSYIVHGSVIDKESRHPLPDVEIDIVLDKESSTMDHGRTGDSGTFHMSLRPRKYPPRLRDLFGCPHSKTLRMAFRKEGYPTVKRMISLFQVPVQEETHGVYEGTPVRVQQWNLGVIELRVPQ